MIVEFFDYRCPYCKSIVANLKKLVDEDKDLRIVLKELPILGPDSTYAAKVSLAARDQPRFVDFHTALISAPGPLNEANVSKIAAAFGISGDLKLGLAALLRTHPPLEDRIAALQQGSAH